MANTPEDNAAAHAHDLALAGMAPEQHHFFDRVETVRNNHREGDPLRVLADAILILARQMAAVQRRDWPTNVAEYRQWLKDRDGGQS